MQDDNFRLNLFDHDDLGLSGGGRQGVTQLDFKDVSHTATAACSCLHPSVRSQTPACMLVGSSSFIPSCVQLTIRAYQWHVTGLSMCRISSSLLHAFVHNALQGNAAYRQGMMSALKLDDRPGQRGQGQGDDLLDLLDSAA